MSGVITSPLENERPHHALPIAGVARGALADSVRGWGQRSLVWRSTQLLAGPILNSALQLGRRRLTVCDVSAGSGELALGLQRTLAHHGVHLDVLGLESDEELLRAARWRAECQRAEDIKFQLGDVLASGVPGQFDVVISSLQVHQLVPLEVRLLLQQAAKSTRRQLLVTDLLRSWPGYWLTQAGRSAGNQAAADHAHRVRHAYNCAEIGGLARTIGLERAMVTRCWPFRFMLSWTPTYR